MALALAPAPAPAPRPPQDLIGLRLAQEKALKRQLEEEQKLKPTGVGVPAASASSSMPAVVPATRAGPTPAEEAMEYREEGPECETPAIFISMDDDSGLAESTLLDSSLEGPLPKVGRQLELQREAGAEPRPGMGLRVQPAPDPLSLAFSRHQEAAAVGPSSKDERSPQSLNHAVEETLTTSSPETREPESKGNS